MSVHDATESLSEMHFPVIGELVSHRHAISPATPVRQVSDDFFEQQQLDAVALVTDGRPVGLVTRTKFLSKVFRQFGWELFARKPVEAVADPSPLILNRGVPLDTALALALGRVADDLYDEIIVVADDGTLLGLLSVRQMVLQQSHALANIIVQKELAHERAREVEEVSRIKSQFLANVTHELRSPVNAIIELAEMMRLATENGYVGQVRDRLSLLMSSATNLRSVITNMLDLSKIESGRMKLFIEACDLVTILHEVAETVRVLLAGKPVDVVVSTESASLPMKSDPVKIRQVLLNLAGNAAKFTETGRISLTLTATDSMVQVAISDTGPGIRQEDLSRLFIAFSQLDDAHTKRHEGTGLGLTITRELLVMLGGNASVTSEFGTGSTFTAQFHRTLDSQETR